MTLDELLQKAEYAEVEAQIQAASQQWDLSRATRRHAIQIYKRAVSLHPHSCKAKLRLSQALDGEGEMEEKIGLLQEVLSLNPTASEKAEAYYLLGEITCQPLFISDGTRQVSTLTIHQNGDTSLGYAELPESEMITRSRPEKEQATEFYRLALRHDPAHEKAAIALADELSELGDPLGAIAALKSFNTHRPDCAAAWLKLAEIYSTQGRHRRCARAYERADDISPINSTSESNLAYSLLNCGRYHAAAERTLRARDKNNEPTVFHRTSQRPQPRYPKLDAILLDEARSAESDSAGPTHLFALAVLLHVCPGADGLLLFHLERQLDKTYPDKFMHYARLATSHVNKRLHDEGLASSPEALSCPWTPRSGPTRTAQ